MNLQDELKTFPLNVIWWFSPIFPTFSAPSYRTPWKYKIFLGSTVLLLCAAGTRTPLYGVAPKDLPHRYYKYSKTSRPASSPATVSQPGSLLDLGVSPIIAASLSIEFLSFFGILNFNMAIEFHRILLSGFKNLLALIVYTGQASYLLWAGRYGATSTLGIGGCLLVFSQLLVGAYLLILLGGIQGNGYRPNGLAWLFLLNMYEFDLQDAFTGPKDVFIKPPMMVPFLHVPLLLLELSAAVLNLIEVIFSVGLALHTLNVIYGLLRKFVNETYLEPEARRKEDVRLLKLFYLSFEPLDEAGFKETTLHHLLNSNNVTSKDDAALITSVIRAAYQEQDRLLAALNPDLGSRPTAAQFNQSLVQAELQGVTAAIAKWRSTLSSVRSLPPDILVTIFRCIPKERLWDDEIATRSLSSSSSSASQVCRTWRTAALSSPELWQKLPILDLSLSNPSSITRRLSLCTLFVNRAQEFNLDVCLWGPNIENFSSDHPLLAFITQHSKSWAKLSVFSTYNFLESLYGVQGSLPTLTHLTLNFGESVADLKGDGGPSDRITLFSDAPRLRYIAIHGSQVGPQVALPKNTNLFEAVNDERPDFVMI